MDKKIIYYIIAGVVLVATVAVIIVMQNPKGGKTDDLGANEIVKTNPPVKSETQAVQDLAAKVGGVGLPLRVTLDDNGQTLSLTPGKNLALMLGADYNWNITSSDNNVLAKRDIKLDDARVQAVYQAVGAGKAVLSATGTCKGTGCAQKEATFKMNVESLVTDNLSPKDLMK